MSLLEISIGKIIAEVLVLQLCIMHIIVNVYGRDQREYK